jgi:AbrB family looped-hinge helix DNA binding protein
MAGKYKRGKDPEHKVAEAALAYDANEDLEALMEEPVLSTISSKNQITLPVQLLRELGIGPGDRVAMVRQGDRLILRPRPKDWPAYYRGSLKGLYGNTKEEIDEYIRELRDDGGREARLEEAWNGQRPSVEK